MEEGRLGGFSQIERWRTSRRGEGGKLHAAPSSLCTDALFIDSTHCWSPPNIVYVLVLCFREVCEPVRNEGRRRRGEESEVRRRWCRIYMQGVALVFSSSPVWFQDFPKFLVPSKWAGSDLKLRQKRKLGGNRLLKVDVLSQMKFVCYVDKSNQDWNYCITVVSLKHLSVKSHHTGTVYKYWDTMQLIQYINMSHVHYSKTWVNLLRKDKRDTPYNSNLSEKDPVLDFTQY